MKELYLNAEMDVVKFSAADVIATSGTYATKENELPTAPTPDDWA